MPTVHMPVLWHSSCSCLLIWHTIEVVSLCLPTCTCTCMSFYDAGMDFNIHVHGNVHNFRRTISLVSADNLAA